MEGLPGPRDRAVQRFRLMGVCAVLALGVLVALLVSDIPHQVRRTITLTTLVAFGLFAVTGFRNRIRASTGRRRQAYWCFAGASLLATLSNLLQLLFPRTGSPSQIVPGDVVLNLALATGVVGLFFFPSARRRATDLTRMVLDGIVIGGSVLLVAAVTLVPDILVDAHRWPLLVVPVCDVVIATLATLLFLRSSVRDRMMLGLTAGSFFCFALSDFGFAFISASQQVFSYGSIIDVGWLSGYLFLALAIWAPRNHGPVEEVQLVETSPVLGTVAMFTLFVAAMGIALGSFAANRVTSPSVVLLLLVVLAVLARQILLVVDNDQLRLSLEQRVQERTRSLRQVTARTDLLVNAVGEGIYGVDRSGLITFVNPATASALGYAPTALIGRDAHATFHAAGPDGSTYPEAECYITEAVREGRVTNAEDDTYLRADGRRLPVEVTATPLSDDGEVVGAVVIFRDVTQRREVDRLKSEFVSMVSHELRTPLTAIQGSLGLISGGALGELPAAAGRMLEIASVSSQRLNRLINDILDVERIESGVLVLEPARHPIGAIVEAAVGQLQVLAAEDGVGITLGPLEGEVWADADRAVQTLINLLGNALKFSYPGSGVVVSARPVGDFVELAVSDEGRGIPEDRLSRIFNRFEQVDSSDAREKGGFGLGLAISKSIVERSGGRIWAVNNVGRGATLHFTLPRPLDPVEDAPELPPLDREPDRVRASA